MLIAYNSQLVQSSVIWCDFFLRWLPHFSSSHSYFSWNRSAVSESIVRENHTILPPNRKFCRLYTENSCSLCVFITWQIRHRESREEPGGGESRTFRARTGGTEVRRWLIWKEAAVQETWEWFAKRQGQEKGLKKDKHEDCKRPLWRKTSSVREMCWKIT